MCIYHQVTPLFYFQYNCDLFFELEECLTRYSEGYVMLLGDFNSRTHTDDDYIRTDIVRDDVRCVLDPFFCYKRERYFI